ncbi:carbamate kinase [candidate division WOR-3 bacterium]|nr:carbamate kinase [candidate division WOR-3 bacterium]MCK4527505.1 carbamate kinase [candidate division WOR-3 bacterium]
MGKIAVVALGGNAILPEGSPGDIHSQFARVRESLKSVKFLLEREYDIVITHGNGPQAGNELIRNELGLRYADVPDLPLGVIVAATEGWMGYMIEQSLQNILKKAKIERDVVTIPTQVIVSRNDPAWSNPTKPIGPFLNKEEAESLRKRGITVIEDAGRGYRRVVPSPIPLEIVEKDVIKRFLRANVIVIAAGGGGIPVYISCDGTYEGLEGVIDKDFASSVLGKDIGAHLLMILTAVPEVYLNFGREDQKALSRISIDEAEGYLNRGEFPPGSMGPKIKAAIEFLRFGGEEVIITSVDCVDKALEGKSGTRIVKS